MVRARQERGRILEVCLDAPLKLHPCFLESKLNNLYVYSAVLLGIYIFICRPYSHRGIRKRVYIGNNTVIEAERIRHVINRSRYIESDR